jgi:hypothetical protein
MRLQSPAGRDTGLRVHRLWHFGKDGKQVIARGGLKAFAPDAIWPRSLGDGQTSGADKSPLAPLSACHVLRALKALSSPKHISARVPLGNRQCWRNTFLSRSGWLAPKVPLQIRIGC